MSTTALRIQGKNMLFMTVPLVKGLAVDIFMADENFEPTGTPSIGVSEYLDEETYHRQLRLEATAKGQFVPEYSTNPELNPGYVESEEPIDSDQS